MNEFVVTCPDCGEEVTTYVEEDVRGSFVQDCEVCCNPWLVRLTRSRVGGISPSVAPTDRCESEHRGALASCILLRTVVLLVPCIALLGLAVAWVVADRRAGGTPAAGRQRVSEAGQASGDSGTDRAGRELDFTGEPPPSMFGLRLGRTP